VGSNERRGEGREGRARERKSSKVMYLPKLPKLLHGTGAAREMGSGRDGASRSKKLAPVRMHGRWAWKAVELPKPD
jgi:hypothetical protein